MLDRWEWGTGRSGSDGGFGTLIPDRVSAISSLFIVRREIDDEARVLGSATFTPHCLPLEDLDQLLEVETECMLLFESK
jgi:hypothetical protein